jgi:hypothetical protein
VSKLGVFREERQRMRVGKALSKERKHGTGNRKAVFSEVFVCCWVRIYPLAVPDLKGN